MRLRLKLFIDPASEDRHEKGHYGNIITPFLSRGRLVASGVDSIRDLHKESMPGRSSVR